MFPDRYFRPHGQPDYHSIWSDWGISKAVLSFSLSKKVLILPIPAGSGYPVVLAGTWTVL